LWLNEKENTVPMDIQQEVSLRTYNTFGIDQSAEQLAILNDKAQLSELKNLKTPLRVLGGGSNILLTQSIPGTVILNSIKGIQLEKENDTHVWVRVGAGEVWHEFVCYAIENNWAGIENLALIPGTVGAAPIQNIGAYGVEVKEVIEQVEVWHLETQKLIVIPHQECAFGYRDSIFKQALAGKCIITGVLFRLSKKHQPNVSYGAIQDALAAKGKDKNPGIHDIAEAVMEIRRSKLPDPKQIGNAGSFFKNPVISSAQYQLLQNQYPHIPGYILNEAQVKIPAGWLIEHAGWKGHRVGNTGVHTRQALVLVNYGHAQGKEILALATTIINSVQEKFGIYLEKEVQIWP
jgi:UDP-N-acetylmuramate dehydrogenase